jgi:hypothetical protein
MLVSQSIDNHHHSYLKIRGEGVGFLGGFFLALLTDMFTLQLKK